MFGPQQFPYIEQKPVLHYPMLDNLPGSIGHKLPLLQHDGAVLTCSVHYGVASVSRVSDHIRWPDALRRSVRYLPHFHHHKLDQACLPSQRLAASQFVLLPSLLVFHDRATPHPVRSPTGLYPLLIFNSQLPEGEGSLTCLLLEDWRFRGDCSFPGHIHPHQLPIPRNRIEHQRVETLQKTLLYKPLLHTDPHCAVDVQHGNSTSASSSPDHCAEEGPEQGGWVHAHHRHATREHGNDAHVLLWELVGLDLGNQQEDRKEGPTAQLALILFITDITDNSSFTYVEIMQIYIRCQW